MADRNETSVIDDIARLIVPSAETLAVLGEHHLKHLIVNLNEGWNELIPLVSPRPPRLLGGVQVLRYWPDASRSCDGGLTMLLLGI